MSPLAEWRVGSLRSVGPVRSRYIPFSCGCSVSVCMLRALTGATVVSGRYKVARPGLGGVHLRWRARGDAVTCGSLRKRRRAGEDKARPWSNAAPKSTVVRTRSLTSLTTTLRVRRATRSDRAPRTKSQAYAFSTSLAGCSRAPHIRAITLKKLVSPRDASGGRETRRRALMKRYKAKGLFPIRK
jgi:hypothetical protein